MTVRDHLGTFSGPIAGQCVEQRLLCLAILSQRLELSREGQSLQRAVRDQGMSVREVLLVVCHDGAHGRLGRDERYLGLHGDGGRKVVLWTWTVTTKTVVARGGCEVGLSECGMAPC